MPFTRITVRHGWSEADLKVLSDTLHEVLVAEFNVPLRDRFQVIEVLPEQRLIYDAHYLSDGRSERYVLLHIVAGKTRSEAQKRKTYQRLSDLFHERLQLRPADLMIIIQQTNAEDWSFSGGEMFELGMIPQD
ncbi:MULTISPECIES: tautomerase family protein [unclassified Pantoea]|uniref:tautomerase family protein n=1 Tax=unclassified Pantoea TaxID=2630326 RepID=UPI001CD2416A|nr:MULTISPECIES: tautomerase family protein [unclassified Pantoea]MCA1177346.1 tautomerase family protein [Pantoea sp. alder69]MCA1249748.1 tautomerase family protein [Pantoea sp. alder70]MCA1265835.1 tautomerase family protein [Pantoea sp. alder81]